jgi:hypothetical protein
MLSLRQIFLFITLMAMALALDVLVERRLVEVYPVMQERVLNSPVHLPVVTGSALVSGLVLTGFLTVLFKGSDSLWREPGHCILLVLGLVELVSTGLALVMLPYHNGDFSRLELATGVGGLVNGGVSSMAYGTAAVLLRGRRRLHWKLLFSAQCIWGLWTAAWSGILLAGYPPYGFRLWSFGLAMSATLYVFAVFRDQVRHECPSKLHWVGVICFGLHLAIGLSQLGLGR